VDDVEVKLLLVDHRACMLIVTLRHCWRTDSVASRSQQSSFHLSMFV